MDWPSVRKLAQLGGIEITCDFKRKVRRGKIEVEGLERQMRVDEDLRARTIGCKVCELEERR